MFTLQGPPWGQSKTIQSIKVCASERYFSIRFRLQIWFVRFAFPGTAVGAGQATGGTLANAQGQSAVIPVGPFGGKVTLAQSTSLAAGIPGLGGQFCSFQLSIIWVLMFMLLAGKQANQEVEPLRAELAVETLVLAERTSAPSLMPMLRKELPLAKQLELASTYRFSEWIKLSAKAEESPSANNPPQLFKMCAHV